MGAGKTALVAGLAVILFLTIVTGIMCGVGSFVVNFVFRNILEKRVSEVSHYNDRALLFSNNNTTHEMSAGVTAASSKLQ